MKIEKNMYVRTKKGEIAKIEVIEKDAGYKNMEYLTLDKNLLFANYDFHIYKEDIKKASFDIIDLIESGDYVNGYLVDYVKKDENDKKWIYLGNTHTYNLCEKDIKSVVTHEQFEEMEYRNE